MIMLVFKNKVSAAIAGWVVAAGLFAVAGFAQAEQNPLSGLDGYVEKSMAQWKTPGLAIAVVKDDRVIVAKGYGTRTYGKNAPVNKDTLFAIGSNSKYFTANALAVLVGEGKIGWDDLMVERLPGFQVADDITTSHATIRDALSHRTGIQRGDMGWFMHPSLTRKEVLGLMKHLKPEQDFRSGYLYNNYMFLAAGEIIPQVTGMSWDKFIATRFFKPLGMKNANTSVTQFGRNTNVATPHVDIEGEVVAVPWHNIDNVGPAGSINASVVDMAQWLRLQLNNGKWGDQVIIPEETLQETRHIYNSTEGDPNREISKKSGFGEKFSGYGLAIAISDSAGYRVYSHGGAIDGMISQTAFVPELGLGIVVLTNMANRLARPLSGWVLDRFTGAAYVDRAADVYEAIEKQEAEARSKVAEIKQNAMAGTRPSHALKGYAGTYYNNLAGELHITLGENGLEYAYGEGFKGVLNHLHFDTFLAQATAPTASVGKPETPAMFSLGVDGAVESVMLGDETFTRNTAVVQ